MAASGGADAAFAVKAAEGELMPFPVREALIVEAEQALGRRLPPTFRERLTKDNGGEVATADDDWTIHPVWDPTDRRTIARTASHIVKEVDQARAWAGFPSDAIPLAINDQGDRIIVRAARDDPEVWDHETGLITPIDIDWR
ncbi:SMI1/KNR4 family protein [Caulobacter sp. UNC358MFTsu5.1]|uniref:SMI1/KNR4 family protein n=1 Tax=Caulobacter sp. UNC358MFTsu5.1 TaxID=1449049 RepID=UPI00068F8C6E|nr:SMI1/KNR4 family protein [Caulobacter sp. UNC358MFTsu5.1]